MAWTAPKTWTVGEVLTAANMNAQVRDNLKELWRELGTAAITSPVTVTATAEATPTDVVATGSLTVAGVPVKIEVWLPEAVTGANATAQIILNLWEGSTNLGRFFVSAQGNTVTYYMVNTTLRRTPSAGSYVYKVAGWRIQADGTVNVGAGGAGNTTEGRITVWERGG